MTSQLIRNNLAADCESCFGLCCVALPYAKSADLLLIKKAVRLAGICRWISAVEFMKNFAMKGM